MPRLLTTLIGLLVNRALPAAAVLALAAPAAQAQSNVLKVNVLSPVVKTGSLFFEHAFSLKSSVQLGLFYTGMSYGKTRAQGFGLTPELRYYFSEKAQSPRGYYVAPYFRYQGLNLRREWSYNKSETDPGSGAIIVTNVTEDAEATLHTVGGGIVVGRQIILKEKVSIDLFAGPGYNTGKLSVSYGHKDLFETRPWKGITARLGVALGINF